MFWYVYSFSIVFPKLLKNIYEFQRISLKYQGEPILDLTRKSVNLKKKHFVLCIESQIQNELCSTHYLLENSDETSVIRRRRFKKIANHFGFKTFRLHFYRSKSIILRDSTIIIMMIYSNRRS